MGWHFKTWIKDGQEFFSYGEDDLPAVRKDFTFAQSLLDFLYLDFNGLHSARVDDMGRALMRIVRLEDLFDNINTVRAGLDALAGSHIYFELLRFDWSARLRELAERKTDSAAILPRKRIMHLTANIIQIQAQIMDLFRRVLDVKLTDKKLTVEQRLAKYYRLDPPIHSGVLQPFMFQPQTTGFEQVGEDAFAEVLYPRDIYELIHFFLRACIVRETPIRVCKSCGKYFAVTGYSNSEYCNRLFKDGDRTCKEVGAVRVLQNKISTDPVHKAYSRAYKTRFARIKYRRITQVEFYAWSAEARVMRDKCLAGNISLEQFQAWLDG